MVVNRLMYGCGALVWYQHECDDLEIRQNGMGQWFWDVGNVSNELIRERQDGVLLKRERQNQW